MKRKKQMVPHKRKQPIMERHHRKPKSLGGTTHPSNCVRIKQTTHRAYHTLFANATPEEMANILNKLCDPEYYFVVRRVKK